MKWWHLMFNTRDNILILNSFNNLLYGVSPTMYHSPHIRNLKKVIWVTERLSSTETSICAVQHRGICWWVCGHHFMFKCASGYNHSLVKPVSPLTFRTAGSLLTLKALSTCLKVPWHSHNKLNCSVLKTDLLTVMERLLSVCPGADAASWRLNAS